MPRIGVITPWNVNSKPLTADQRAKLALLPGASYKPAPGSDGTGPSLISLLYQKLRSSTYAPAAKAVDRQQAAMQRRRAEMRKYNLDREEAERQRRFSIKPGERPVPSVPPSRPNLPPLPRYSEDYGTGDPIEYNTRPYFTPPVRQGPPNPWQ